MAPFAVDRTFFIQIMTRNAEPVGCRLVPVSYFPGFLVMTLPAFVVGSLLVLMVSEINGLLSHLQLYNPGASVFRLGSHQRRCDQKR